jgi:hypothetical protein
MTLRTTLFSGIAGLAIAAALSFGAQAQTYATASQATWQQGVMMSSGNASRPVAKHIALRHRHYVRTASSDSTPAEQAATDQLNMQQLRAARN